MKTLYIICADPANSSCIINAIYENRIEAERWVRQENKKLEFEQYWVESCSNFVKQ